MFNKIRTFAVFAVLLTFVCGCNLIKKPAIELSLGAPAVIGSLEAGGVIWYTVHVVEECFLTVETFGDTDIYLEAYDVSRRNLITENGGGDDGNNARVEFHAIAGNTYTFRLRGANEDVAGAYLIRAIDAPIIDLMFDTTHRTNLAPGANHWYKIGVNQRSIVNVYTTSGIDTYLEVYDSFINFLRADDDGGENNNASVNIVAEPNHYYYFKLRGYHDEVSGDYNIIASTVHITDMSLGGAYRFMLERGANHWYSVSSNETSIITVETTGEVDTYLEVYDSHFNIINSDDDGGMDLNASIDIFAEPGVTYYFKLRGYNEDRYGEYTIHANTASTNELRLGIQQNVFLASGAKHWYYLSSSERTIIAVETTGNVDTYLDAFDSHLNFINSDDDSGSGYNALVEFFVEPYQVYYLRLRGVGGSPTGTYGIKAISKSYEGRNTERSSAITLANGEVVPVNFYTEDEGLWYRYEVPRDNTNLTFYTWGDLDTMLYLYDSQGHLIFEDDDSGEDLNAYISSDLNRGSYFIEIRTFSGVTGRTTFQIESYDIE